LAILIAAFMTGMAVGGYMALRRVAKTTGNVNERRRFLTLLALQVAAAVFPIALVVILVALRGVTNPTGAFAMSHLGFPIVAAIAGGLGGYQFPIASDLYFQSPDSDAPITTGRTRSNPGSLYALDLAGACLGACLLSAYLIPVFGFAKTAVAIAAVNIAPALLFALALITVHRD
jgi:hypothetical protein